jgi:hypothetical protein
MRTVIKNKVYDTTTAAWIADYTHSGVTETLYRKKTGEYFAHFFNERAEDTDKAGWRGKEKVVPYDFDTARAWGELRLDKARYKELFGGDTGESGSTVVSIRVSRATLAKMRKAQSETGESIGQIFDRLAAVI